MCSLSVFLEFVLSVSRFLLLRFLYLQDADPSNGIRSKQTSFSQKTQHVIKHVRCAMTTSCQRLAIIGRPPNGTLGSRRRRT